MENKYTDLSNLDTYKVLKNKLTLSDVLILNWIKVNIEADNLTRVDLYGKKYYSIQGKLIFKEIGDCGVRSSDTAMKRLKNLPSEIVDVVNGEFPNKDFGYSRIAVKLGKKFYDLYKGEE
jgi:hypothetical protein